MVVGTCTLWPSTEYAVTDLPNRCDRTIRDTAVTGNSNPPATGNSSNRKKHYDPVINSAWCKACGICSEFCPKKVIGLSDMGVPIIERPDDCIGCRFCELHCPDFAITVKERTPEGFSGVDALSNCHVQFGRKNNMESPVKMMKWCQEHAVTIDKARQMKDEERENKVSIGVLMDSDKPSFLEKYQTVREQAKASLKK